MKNSIIDKDLYNEIKFGSNVISGEEYTQTFLAIAELASELVVKTLGPHGKTTIIDDTQFAYPTKDGWSVLKLYSFSDPLYNTLFGVLKKVSFALVEKVGDGTTSALVGANVFMHAILEYQATHDFRQQEFLDMLNTIAEEITEALNSDKYVHRIDPNGDFSDIERIALIASNGNKKLAQIIKDIYQKTNNPNIYVTYDPSDKLSYDIQVGYKFDCKTIMHKAYINDDSGICKKSNPTIIAIFDHNVTYNEHAELISALSRYATANESEVVIIAPHFDDIITNIIGTTINSFLQRQQVPNIMMVQVPLSMEIHRQYLSDVVLLTNAQVFDYGKVRAFNVLTHNQKSDEKIEDALLQVDNYKFESPTELIETCVGRANYMIIAEKYIVIQEYENIVNKQLYAATLEEVKNAYLAAKEKANKSSTMLMKEYMDAYQRYTKLSGKLGIIKVGGGSDLEKHCLKDAVDDAVLACRSAYDNGYIRGMNLATLTVIKKFIDEVEAYGAKDSNTDDEMQKSFSELYAKYQSMTKEEIELRKVILGMLYRTFNDMSLAVLRNKYEDDKIKRKVKIVLSSENNGVTSTDAELGNKEIINYCVDNGMAYNLVTERIEPDSEATVINSVATDTEILNGIISILSLMLTSNQLLTLTRTYDRKMSKKQLTEAKIEEKVQTASAVVEAVLDILEKKNITLVDVKQSVELSTEQGEKLKDDSLAPEINYSGNALIGKIATSKESFLSRLFKKRR